MSRISVIIPTYEHADTIAMCLDALLVQKRMPDEIIVVDDGSTDNTQEVLAKYQQRIAVIKQRNQGAPIARNVGFRAATGDYVIFCDADVVMAPEMLKELETALIAHPEASYAYSSFKWGWKKFASRSFDDAALKERNFIHTSALIRKEHFPGFAEDVKRFQDWDLWLTMLEQQHRGVFVEKELFRVHVSDSRTGISSWLPSFIIRFPWKHIGWMPKRVRAYNEAREAIVNRHSL